MSEAVIRWIGGPVLYARTSDDFHVGEAIEVGIDRRPGEVIRLKSDELVGQVYEDTTGLRPGDACTALARRCRCAWVRGCSAASSTVCCGRSTPQTRDEAPIAFRALVKARRRTGAGDAIWRHAGDRRAATMPSAPAHRRHG